ncbi:hypothetical protein JW766_05590 [Candidatus Dojkabacteria bacterium]|nr:hypothetical protein [Candidatus Dojkabacteria bacterium]
MKKNTKIIIVVLVVIVVVLPLLGFVMLKVFVLPPSSQQVCEKVRDLMVEQYKEEMGGDSEQADQLVLEIFGSVDDCVEEEEKSRENKGLLDVRKEGKCILAADKFDDLEKCDAR